MKINSCAVAFIIFLGIGLIINGCDRGNTSPDENQNADSAAVAENDSTIEGQNQQDNKNRDDQEDLQLELIPVEVSEAKLGNISKFLLLSASMKTEEQVAVFPEVSGIVRAILAEEGDRLEEGDTLMILDDVEKILDRDAAYLDYQEKQVEYDRALELKNKHLISQRDFDLARFSLERARIAYERAELNLSRTRVLAPISGYVADRIVNRGDLVNMSTMVYSLVNPTDMIAEIHIPEAELPHIDKNKEVRVSTDVYPDRIFTSQIKRISPVVDPASGTFRVTIGVHDEEEILKPGMFVNVRIVTDVHRDVVLVPKQALIFENDLPYIYVVRDSLALKTLVKSGFDDNRFIEVLDYIQPGDLIVIVGQSGLKDSVQVKIIDMEQIRQEALKISQAQQTEKQAEQVTAGS